MVSYNTPTRSRKNSFVSMTLINCRFILVLGLVSMYLNHEFIIHFFEHASLLSSQKNTPNLRSTLLLPEANNGLQEDLKSSSIPSSLERKVSQQLLQNLQQPMPKATNGVQYSVNTFQLSLGHSTVFEYSLHNPKTNQTIMIQNSTSMDETEIHNIASIVCELHPVHELNMNHIPHFSQTAFPCWSILESYKYKHVQKFMRFNGMVKDQLTSQWIQDLLHVFESQNITLLNHGQDVPMVSTDSVWYAQLTNGPFGGFPRQVENTKWGPKFELENAQYFLKSEHVHSLQKAVLGELYQESINKLSNEPIRFVLIDRKNHTREWIYAQETKDAIQDIYNDSEVVVNIVSNPSGSLQTQANTMYRSDIIISPHGAQLTNLAFIRPCTAVLELFPRGYYLGYFQPLVLSAGALSFDGYPWDRSHFLDTYAIVYNVKKREMIRKWEISTSPESIVRGLPEMISSLITCRNIHSSSEEVDIVAQVE